MKNVLLAIALFFICALQLKAQIPVNNGNAVQSLDKIEFMGLSLGDNDITAFGSLLEDNGYTLLGKRDDSTMYKGVFNNLAAQVMVVPFDDSENVKDVVIFLENLNPTKAGNLYAELLQKFMTKYQNYKYDTYVDRDGSHTATFTNNAGFLALQASVIGMGKCRISIFYCTKPATDTNTNSGGIGVDDL